MVIPLASVCLLPPFLFLLYVIRFECGLLSPCLLTYLSNKCCSYRERTVGCRQWKRRQTPGRRSKHDFCAVPRIKFGIMAKAFKHVVVARCPFQPASNGTPRVRADRRIANDAIGSARARLIIQLGWVKSDDQHLVQPRALADHRGFWILGPGLHRRSAEF